ncbi:hypothetical protein GF386_01610 [Candidatus Pacearchaeota archaeon]|nr:hypothetical protein [Candidatus Pacearchaeota archaeon]MBD3282876.1 hypothetical protein [Candidatus Pacearchaeota archaeon]
MIEKRGPGILVAFLLVVGFLAFGFVISNVHGDFRDITGAISAFAMTPPPYFDPVPVNQVVEYGEALGYDVNATPSGSPIDSYFIDDNGNFTINNSGFIKNNTILDLGIYSLNISVNDTDGDINFSLINVTVQDTTSPYFDFSIENQNINCSQEFNYDIDASDNVNISSYFIDDNGNFTINSSGFIKNNTVLSPRRYFLNISVNDSSGNTNSSSIKINVNIVNTTNITANISTLVSFDVVDTSLTLFLVNNVSSTLTLLEEGSIPSSHSDLEELKTINITTDSNTSGNLEWCFINISYSGSELSSAGISNESRLKIYYYNDSSSSWQLEENQDVVTGSNYVWANITHFSLFSVFGNDTNVSDDNDNNDTNDDDSSSGGDNPTFNFTGYWTLTYYVPETQFRAGYNRLLGLRKRVRVTINNTNHYVGVVSLISNAVTINVSSDPQQAVLLDGENKSFDVLGDGYYDINVKLNNIDTESSRANLTITFVHDKIPETTSNESEVSNKTEIPSNETSVKEESGRFRLNLSLKTILWSVGVIVLLVVVLFIAFIVKDVRKDKKLRSKWHVVFVEFYKDLKETFTKSFSDFKTRMKRK